MHSHRLDPLLRPKSVAVVGASKRASTVGNWALKNLVTGGFRGRIYPVNPNYDEIQGHRCWASIARLPEVPELVIFGVGDHRLEAALDEALAAGVPAAVIQSTVVIDDDADPPLRERLREKIVAAGMLVCGPNCMGYYNVRDCVWTCGFDSAMHRPPGKVALISHSGSGMSGIMDCEERLQFNFAVSSGSEFNTTMDEYLDFALDLSETRVVGLFIETSRNPSGFEAALKKAASRRIPIVALKVGRTAKSAELAISHSGAIVGDDETYEALFDRYGVQRARDQDEFATMLIMFSELHPVGDGGLVTLHDSGGEQQLIIDLADEMQVPLTELSGETVEKLTKVLAPESPAVNPLDAWSRGGPDSEEQMTECLSLLMQDSGAALGAVVMDRAPFGKIFELYFRYMRRSHEASGKPVALVSATQGTGHDENVVKSTHAGMPILDGVVRFLAGVRALFAYRDFLARGQRELHAPAADVIERWQARLAGGATLGEFDALAMLADFGLQTSAPVAAAGEEAVLEAAAECGYPLVLKSAVEGLHHKTDQQGVVVGIADAKTLRFEYSAMRERLGDDVLIASQAKPGVEMIIGIKRDSQFGPVVVIGFGGVLAETIADVQFALPPFDRDHARRCLDRMRLRPLLDGVRGAAAVDVDAFCVLAERFSVMAAALCDDIAEVDVNPVIVNTGGAVAVDALAVGLDRRGEGHAET